MTSENEEEELSIDLSRVPLHYLIDELGKRSSDYAYAFVDEKINDVGAIVHFDIVEKYPGSMAQFLQSLIESSKERCDDFIIRTLQDGKRFSALGYSKSEEEEDNFS